MGIEDCVEVGGHGERLTIPPAAADLALQLEALGGTGGEDLDVGPAAKQATHRPHGCLHLFTLAMNLERRSIGVQLEEVERVVILGVAVDAVDLETWLLVGGFDERFECCEKFVGLSFGGGQGCDDAELRHVGELTGRWPTHHILLTQTHYRRTMQRANHRVVVVEDERDIADLLILYFEREGWTVHWCGNGEDGLETIRARQPDLVVLDIGLPGMTGLDVCREIRTASDVPVLFLTARDDEIDRVLGLELGADDYVTKPFSPREVVARVNAILRRGRIETAAVGAEFGAVSIDLDRHEATVDGNAVTLATQEFRLLTFLCENVGVVLSRQQLLDGAWGEGWIGDTRTVDVHVRQLRKKLGDDLPLATIRGAGYRLG